METIAYYSPIGTIEITGTDEQIFYINTIEGESKFSSETSLNQLKKCKLQLEEYFSGKRNFFELNINEDAGTDFQRKVWTELRKIPYAETVSYGEIARRIENPKASRAVGLANNKNPNWIITPCHRVIGANGKMVGFGGGIWRKEFLLALEKQYKWAK
jgi:methylated-DNA-[protein]-cysteine S-methyltransferase